MTHVYAGIHAADRSRLPPSLWGQMWRGPCTECAASVVCHRPSLDRHKRFWFLRGVELRIVCPTCADRLLHDRGGLELFEFTTEVGRHFCRG
jgi:hypothetical protein